MYLFGALAGAVTHGMVPQLRLWNVVGKERLCGKGCDLSEGASLSCVVGLVRPIFFDLSVHSFVQWDKHTPANVCSTTCCSFDPLFAEHTGCVAVQACQAVCLLAKLGLPWLHLGNLLAHGCLGLLGSTIHRFFWHWMRVGARLLIDAAGTSNSDAAQWTTVAMLFESSDTTGPGVWR